MATISVPIWPFSTPYGSIADFIETLDYKGLDHEDVGALSVLREGLDLERHFMETTMEELDKVLELAISDLRQADYDAGLGRELVTS